MGGLFDLVPALIAPADFAAALLEGVNRLLCRMFAKGLDVRALAEELTLSNPAMNEALPGFFTYGRFEVFDKLENYDAEGFRLVAYPAILAGSTMAVGRIYDVTDTLWTS